MTASPRWTFVVERKGREVAAIIPAEGARRLEAFARRRSIELEAVQDAFVGRKSLAPGSVESAVADAARDVKAKRKARRR